MSVACFEIESSLFMPVPEIIAALCEGIGQRAVTRLAGVDRKTVTPFALRVGKGCAELQDRIMVGVRTERLERDETWSFLGKRNTESTMQFPAPFSGTGGQ